jgi:hypothetical protein
MERTGELGAPGPEDASNAASIFLSKASMTFFCNVICIGKKVAASPQFDESHAGRLSVAPKLNLVDDTFKMGGAHALVFRAV